MNTTLSLNGRGWVKVWRFLILALLLLPGVPLISAESLAANAVSPLQESGLTPLWHENFENGSIDRMQYSWANGSLSAMTSYVQPGAIYLGRNGGCPAPLPDPCDVEQQINNFKRSNMEPLPLTIEFDVYSSLVGRGPLSLRPSRWGDMTSVFVGLEDGLTEVKFGRDNQAIQFNERTGPTYNSGWAHVVISYKQDHAATAPCFGALCAHFVVAINDEVHDLDRLSELIPGSYPDWASEWANDPGADGWSLEHTSDLVEFGKYVANIRAYSDFLTLAQLQTRLPVETVDSYLASLPNPTEYSGAKKVFQDAHKTLTQQGPNAMAYWARVAPLNISFDGSFSSAYKEINSYDWTFGDGKTGSGRSVNHVYSAPGTYYVTLTVATGTSTDSHTIQVTVDGPSPSPSPMLFKVFIPHVTR